MAEATTLANAFLLPEEASLLGEVGNKRCSEFTLGRTCARQALTALGERQTPILRGSNSEPLWPPGFAGSITHCSGYCAAAVARCSDFVTLGIDAEPNEPLPEGVLNKVAMESERQWLSSHAGSAVCWDRLLFSAKESVYKAWFPLTGLWLGFHDAVTMFHLENNTFVVRLLVPVRGRRVSSFTGHYLCRNGLILTSIVLD